jgi:hypothetical protein
MNPTKQLVARVAVWFGAAVFLGAAAAWGQTYSQARIVRLSFVEGTETVQRPEVADWAEAPINTPLEEGFKLSTAENSFAEVEFENGSTVRLGQLSMLEFTQLALASDGSKINRLTMDNGYATFHAAPEGQDVYEVDTPNGTLTPRGKVMFRVDADPSAERVEVFSGSLEVASSLGSWTLAKNSVLELWPGTEQPSQLSEGITKDDWDSWVQERESRAEAASNGPSPSAYVSNDSGTFYGWSDLSYYGNWSFMPGYGFGWIPNVYEGWYPYSHGRWSWYPGFGYTWISADPWGWLPFHCGAWDFIPGMAWMWFPGGCGIWSPALVSWYAGPGWIGWVPRFHRPHPIGTNPCPQARACGTVVSTTVFQTGRPVSPGNVLLVNLASGKRIERPEILPDRQAMLPGRIVAQPAGFANGKRGLIGAGTATISSQAMTGGPANLAPGAVTGSSRVEGGSVVRLAPRPVAPGPKSEIVYDPTEGRYVNRPLPPSGVPSAPNGLSSGSEPSALGTTTAAPGQTGASSPSNSVLIIPSGSGSANAPERAITQTVRPLRLAPSARRASEMHGVQPSSGTPQKPGATAAAQGHSGGWFHRSAPRSGAGSSAAPRSGGSAPSGQATGSSGSLGSGTSGGAAWGGSGGTGGGSHGGGTGSGGPHR